MKKFRYLSGIMCGILLCSLVLTGCSQGDSSHLNSETSISESIADNAPSEKTNNVYEQGTQEETTTSLKIRDGLSTLLVMGIDKTTDKNFAFELDPEDGHYLLESFGYLNNQQTDFMMLLVIDKNNKVCDAIHINRDTIVEFDRLGIGSKPAGKVTEQITLAHTYGNGEDVSYRNSCNAVSNLLMGIPVDHYVALDLSGFVKLNDLSGGVELQIPIDMTQDDPIFKADTRVHLEGIHSVLFVRARMGIGDGSNLSRMERQRQYLAELHAQMMRKIMSDPQYIPNTLSALLPNMHTDLSLMELTDLCLLLKDCNLNPFITIDGEEVVNTYKEYHVDPDAVKKIVNDLFLKIE